MKKLLLPTLLLAAANGLMAQTPGTWIRSLALTDYNYPAAVWELNGPKYMVCGTCGGAFEQVGTCFLTVDTLGNIIDSRRFGNSYFSRNRSATMTADSGYVTIGTANKENVFDYDIYIERYDKNLVKLWDKSIGYSGWDEGKHIAELPDGFVLSGYVSDTITSAKNAFACKIDFDGNIVWQRILDLLGDDELNCIKPIKKGGILAIGTKENAIQQTDYLAVKFDLNGDTAWTALLDYGKYDNGYDFDEIAIDSTIVYCGTTYVNSEFSDTARNVLGKLNLSGSFNSPWDPGYNQSAKSVNAANGYIVIAGEYYSNSALGQEGYLLKLYENGSFFSGNTAGNDPAFQDLMDVIPLSNSDKYLFLGNNHSNDPLIHNILLVRTDKDTYFDITNTGGVVSAPIQSPKQNYSISPNPSNGEIHIKGIDAPFGKLKVYNSIGQILLEKEILNSCSLDIQLNQGIYFFSLCDKDDAILTTQKVIVN